MSRRNRNGGQETRTVILDHAVDLASLEGLDSLSIGRLAEQVGMSKSGLFAHFGSKQELQLEAIESARQRYYRMVMEPILQQPDGLPRLLAMCRGTLAYLRDRVFPGGCFFVITRAEFGARPGPVRDKIFKNKNWGRQFIADTIRAAQDQGDLNTDEDAEQLAFEIESLWDAPNWALHTECEAAEIERARRAIESRLKLAGVRDPSI